MTDTLTPNVPLLQQTLAYIETHPAEWDQSVWRCGTTACFAGTAAMLDGGVWSSENTESPFMRVHPDDPDEDVWAADDIHSRRVHVEERAMRVLGLTPNQASNLFCGGNDLDDLRWIVGEIVESAS